MAAIVGIDLSGPVNVKDTSVACFDSAGGVLRFRELTSGADDHRILSLVAHLAASREVVVGIDAPLSYNPGGGDRPADARLRRELVRAGLPSGAVMTPTMTRMVYLTLRGVFVAGRLERSKGKHPVHIIETHPAGALVLRGFPAGMALGWKLNEAARRDALLWMREHGVQNLVLEDFPTSHDVAACAAAFGAWKWHGGESVWASPAAPPLHPYDFAC